ncbi:hypothetical protein [Streptosporangium sp. NPDC048865]|uniref:hypothetical protein n=1 Tax=Streptosporangium sp. NPDC048865 TaxID=3155766 RepID=UPI00344765EC
MSDHISSAHRPAGGGAYEPRRPGTLLAATLATAVTAASMLASAAVSLVAGRSLLRDYVHEELGVEAGSEAVGAVVDTAVEAAFGSLQARAYVWLFLAAILVLLLLPVRGGRTWARVVLSVLAPAVVLLGVRDLTDMVSPVTGALAALATLGALLAVVTCWLPASNRYARARKPSSRSRPDRTPVQPR